LKNEALLHYGVGKESNKPKPGYARTFGSLELTHVEKAIVANASAVREWDSNGTVFGYRKELPAH